MRFIVVTLGLLFLLLQAKLWFGNGSMMDAWQLDRAIAVQQADNQRLRERNAALAAEVADLKGGVAAIEERARRELGMIKRGETFFQVVE